MKTLIAILFLPLLTTSCKKKETSTSYTCTCKVSSNYGYLYTTEPTYSNITRDEAQARCNEEKLHQQNLVIYDGYQRKADCTLH